MVAAAGDAKSVLAGPQPGCSSEASTTKAGNRTRAVAPIQRREVETHRGIRRHVVLTVIGRYQPVIDLGRGSTAQLRRSLLSCRLGGPDRAKEPR